MATKSRPSGGNGKNGKNGKPPGAREGFGTFGGVFTPCTLTILGVIMFLRAEVSNTDGQVLGSVADLIETGAHDVLVIKPSGVAEESAEDILVPFHANYVLEVDMAAKRIQVDWQAAEMD